MTPAELRLLILETSCRVGQVALAQGERILCCRRLDETRRHARDLAPAVADFLRLQGWRPQDVQAVIVSHGPGSYTGLRVGIMSAKAFAFATGCVLLAVDTFAAIAQQAAVDVNRLDVIADAQQDRIYVQRFVRNRAHANWRAKSPLSIQPLADWLVRRETDVPVSGPGLHVYQSRFPPGLLACGAEQWDPRPDSHLRIGLERYRRGERDDLWALEPLYLRPSAAEVKMQTGTAREAD